MMPNSSAAFWLSTRFCATGHPWANLGPLSWPCPLPAPGAPPGTSLAGQHRELAGPWPQVSTAQKLMSLPDGRAGVRREGRHCASPV